MCENNILLKIGYWFYVHTRFGRWYFNRSLEKIESTFPLGHSAPLMMDFGEFHVHVVAYCKDNYGFIIWRNDSKKCIIVDPGHFPPFAIVMSAQKLILDSVLITHKHYDHCGSIDAIRALFPEVKIFSHKNERVAQRNCRFSGSVNDIEVCEETFPIQITAYHTPGHTVGHAIYTINTQVHNVNPSLLVFTGDAIFLGSIGAMFEGDAKLTVRSLEFFLRELIKLNIPANKIHLFPGHEYSVESLQFLVYNCSPYSTLAKKKLSWCEEQRSWLLPTIPVTLFDELSYSPYLRIAISTFPNEERLNIIYHSESMKKTFFLPHIQELLHELLLSEDFIKTNLMKKDCKYHIIKEKLFRDLFTGKNKMLLRCEICSPEPFATNANGTTLPPKCIRN